MNWQHSTFLTVGSTPRRSWLITAGVAALIALPSPAVRAADEQGISSESPLEILRRKVSSENDSERLAAIERADRFGKDAVPIVAVALSDDIDVIRAAAVVFIGEHSGPDGLRYFTPMVGEENSKLVLYRMLPVLHDWGTPAAIETIMKVITPSNLELQLRGLDYLQTLKHPSVGPFLVALSREAPNSGVRARAFDVLSSLEITSGVAEAAQALSSDDNDWVRYRAAKHLAIHSCDSARSALEGGMKQSSQRAREASAASLAQSCGDKALASFASMLDWSGAPGQPEAATYKMKASAANMLVKHPVPEGRPLLLRLLKEDQWFIRREAIFALGSLGGPEAMKTIASFTGDPHRKVRDMVANQLGKAGGAAAIPALSGMLVDSDLNVRQTAARVLGELGDAAAATALVKALGDNEIAMRIQVASSLGSIGNRSAVPALIGAAKDAHPMVRANAIGALGSIKDVKAMEVLIGGASDDDPLVRKAAVVALGQIGDARGKEALQSALRDTDPGVRAAARDALE